MYWRSGSSKCYSMMCVSSSKCFVLPSSTLWLAEFMMPSYEPLLCEWFISTHSFTSTCRRCLLDGFLSPLLLLMAGDCYATLGVGDRGEGISDPRHDLRDCEPP